MKFSECVYANRVLLKYKYSDEYVNFILKKIIYDIKFGSEQDILHIFFEYFNKNDFKVCILKKRLAKIYGNKIKGKYFLSNSIKNDIENYYFLKFKCDNIYHLSNRLIFDYLNFDIDNYDKFIDSVIYYIILKLKINNYDYDETIIYIYYYIKNFNENYYYLMFNVRKVKHCYYNLPIFRILNLDNFDKNLLIKNNINTFKDFISQNVYVILYFISLNYNGYLKLIKQFGISVEDAIKNAFLDIKEKDLEIVIKRNGYIDGNKCTLEQIGNKLNVTKERIRQLEANTIKKIRRIAIDKFNILLVFFYCESEKLKPYITLSKLKIKYDFLFVNKILLLFEYGNINIIYNSEYQILYDTTINDINVLINDTVNKIGIVAGPSKIAQSDLFTLNVIKHNYKKITEKLYLKNNCPYRDLYLVLIEELFPKGFCPGNAGEYNIFVKTVNDRYKIFENIPSKRSLEGMIRRGAFIQIDRGKYLSNKYVAILTGEMLDKILSYVSENEITYYNAIFEKFLPELKKIGINNRYYLKGCLDKHLPPDMKTKRDYIVCGNINKTPYEIVLNKLHSVDSFTKGDIQNIFPGLKDYTIYNFLYMEVKNGLIWISSNEFKYIDKYKIDVTTKIELKKFIDMLFIKLNTTLLTSKKIYAKLQLTNKKLLDKLYLTNGHFELFSIIKEFYNNNYYFSRPYVFLEEGTYNTRSTIIQNYVSQYDSFNYKMIQDYQNKMNLGGLYNYLEFMESMSDKYVWVDTDEMVRIDKMNLNDITIKKIQKTIDLILDNFGVIKTVSFNGYSLLPRISYAWNKYLLVGIVRSYLSEYYDIKNTDNKYRKTEFEIRRCKYD